MYRRLSARILDEGLADDVLRVDDYLEVNACFQADDEAERAGRPRRFSSRGRDGGWLVTDDALWHEALQRVNQAVLRQRRPGRAIFIEFARPEMVPAIERNFSPEIRASSLLLYIFCPFDICWERNLRRHRSAAAAGHDDHLVSREEMERTYLHDDHDRLHQLGIPFLVVDNHLEGDGFLDYGVQEVVALLKRA